ncbi:hypothetical protein KCD56_000201 [Salmonella enterica subsp. enterica serovar Infantis]|nr:hypothetical protein [Salmonella enterica subsp. enterica serovar Infantis]HCB4392187.1 hypothetical protein [Salmonella enterica]HCB4404490.1 hypothetical protein [Salmonella enterica]
MAISQTFKSTVVFGGRIDPSFKRSSEDLKDAVRQTGQTVSQLTKKQEKLKEKIAATKLAGRDVSELTRQYQKLDRQIKEVTTDQEKLNKQISRQQRLEKWGGRARGAAKWGAGKVAGGIGAGIKWGGAGVMGAAIGIPAAALAVNANTAEKLGLARSYGVGIEKYAAWDNIGKMAGLNGENVGDLTEELTNKIGEAGNEKTLNPMLFQIGLSKKRMAGWDREKQFNEVMSRLSRIKDDKVAASLADQLMGGEANKIVTYMRLTGKTWEQTMEEAKKSNLLTKEGAEGGARAHFAITNLWNAVSSGLADTLGKISNEFAPEIDKAQDSVIAWIKNNQGLIVNSVKEWMTPDKEGKNGIDRLWEKFVNFGNSIAELTRNVLAAAEFLGLITNPEELKKRKETISQYLENGNSYEGAKQLADEYDLEDWFKENYSPEKADELKKAAADRNGTAEQLAKRQGITTPGGMPYGTYAPRVEINVQTLPGQNAEEIAGTVYEKYVKSLPSGPGQSGSMFDTPIASG